MPSLVNILKPSTSVIHLETNFPFPIFSSLDKYTKEFCIPGFDIIITLCQERAKSSSPQKRNWQPGLYSKASLISLLYSEYKGLFLQKKFISLYPPSKSVLNKKAFLLILL